MIYSVAGDPTPEATERLEGLLDRAAPSYQDTIRHALAQQRRAKRDQEYAPSTLAQVESVSKNTLPETVDDMRAYFGDRLAVVQARMHATNTDIWEAY